MKHLFFFAALLSVSFLNSCKKPENVDCGIAKLNIYNNDPTRAVVFKWSTSQQWDTIMPGETTTVTAKGVKIEYAIDGSLSSISTSFIDFETDSATYTYQFKKCNETINAPDGFIQFDQDCGNGVYNPESGELDIDCGGFCIPCTPPTFNCSAYYNQVTWNTSGFHDDNLYSSIVRLNNSISIDFSLFGSSLFARINHNKLPTKTTRYDIGELPHQISLYYKKSFTNYLADSNQHVYIVKESNGDLSLRYCDLSFSKGNTTITGSAYLGLDY